MPSSEEVREALDAVSAWLRDETTPVPDRTTLARAVRLTARALAASAPGSSVEVRIPPFVAVQCVEGPRHTRGTPANVVETDARTWLLLVSGLITIGEAETAGRLLMSGSRANAIVPYVPIIAGAGE